MYDEWVEDTLLRFNRLSHLIHPNAKQLLIAYSLEEDHNKKEELRDEIESMLGAYETRFLTHQRHVFASPTNVTGELILGTVVVGDEEVEECRIPVNGLTRHLIVYAQTGHLWCN